MTISHRARRAVALLLLGALAATACSSGSDDADEATPSTPDDQTADTSDAGPPSGAPAAFDVQPSVEQLIVTGAGANEMLTVYDAVGDIVAEAAADELGQLIVRFLEPGAGYVVAAGSDDTLTTSPPTEVWSLDDPPDPTAYDSQVLEPGYQYVETRDGTLLAVNVTLPGPVEDGPYPTVVEYSGYDPANPDAPQPSSLAAQALGFATVGVNVRGTGCSGGAFLVFERAESADGYDVIEVVGRQDWVEHSAVGMVGLSYPGIMELFVAQTNPPHLAAIAPLSVIADTYRSTLRPGGILNNGFATTWAQERQDQAAPGGQPWAQKRIDEGDATCATNQDMRSQNADMFDIIENHPYYDDLFRTAAPAEFVDQIDVPVFLAGAWQDEQTGGHFPTMLDDFTAAPVRRFTLTNGGHTDSFGPEIFSRWAEFLDLYVKHQVPALPDSAAVIGAILGSAIFGVDVALPTERFGDVTSYDEALARFEAEDPVRVLFENGAGGGPGVPIPTFEATFESWPIPDTEPTTWHLVPGGALDASASDDELRLETFEPDVDRSQVTTLADGANPWTALPPWQWSPPAPGTALAYESEPLSETLVMAGSGRVDLDVVATAPDVDVQVVLTEVRPDGKETYVQSGWLRVSHRALDEARTTELAPYHTHLEADAAPIEAGSEDPTPVNVEIFPFAHVFRAGSRIRIIVSGPGGVRPEWRFDTVNPDGVRIGLAGSGSLGTLTLPVLPALAASAPPDLAPCPSLRGQPCRDYATIENGSEPLTDGAAEGS